MTSSRSTPPGPTCVFCGEPRDPENGPGCARCNRLRSLPEDWTSFPQAYCATEQAAGQELEGRTIRLVRCADPHTRLRPGHTGVVTLVDGIGTVHVHWDDGHRLGLIPGIDAWEVVDE